MPSPPPPVPPELAARFEAVRLLGEGAFGRVIEARDLRTGGSVALKLLDPEIYSRPGFHERFQREARTGARIQSPRVAALLDSGVAGRVPFLVFELIVGPTLATHLADHGGRLSPERALSIFRGILEGLRALEAAGVVHRDLKPANVMLGPGGHPVLTDLGLARTLDEATLTRTGEVLGTIAYMPPDQLLGEPPGPDWDLYAAAAVLVEMLLGEIPFDAGSVGEILSNKQRGLVAGLRAEGLAIPAGLDHLVRDLLSPDRARRPASASATLERLEDAIAGAEAPARTATVPVARAPEFTRGAAAPRPAAPVPAPPVPSGPARGRAATLVAMLALAGIAASWPSSPAPRHPASPSAPRRTPAQVAGQLEELRDRVLRSDRIEALRALDERSNSDHAIHVLGAARNAYRARAAELRALMVELRDLYGDAPLPPLAHSAAAELFLVQEILRNVLVPGFDVAELLPASELPPLEDLLGRGQAVRRIPAERWLGHQGRRIPSGLLVSRRDDRAPRIAQLSTEGVVAATLHDATSDSGLRIQSLGGQPFADTFSNGMREPGLGAFGREMANQSHDYGETAQSLEMDVTPRAGPLRLLITVHDWTPYAVMRLDLRGTNEDTALALHPPPRVRPETDEVAFQLTVPASLLPGGLRRLRLTARGCQPLADASMVVNVDEVLHLARDLP